MDLKLQFRWRFALVLAAMLVSSASLVLGARGMAGVHHLRSAGEAVRSIESQMQAISQGTTKDFGALRVQVAGARRDLAEAKSGLEPLSAAQWVPKLGPRIRRARQRLR